jgi:hypothetical protein
MTTCTNFLSLAALRESWSLVVWLAWGFILIGAAVGTAGGGLAFVRAKEGLRQRLVLGALAGALTSWLVTQNTYTFARPLLPQGPRWYVLTAFVFWCVVGGYAGADGISTLWKAIGRGNKP